VNFFQKFWQNGSENLILNALTIFNVRFERLRNPCRRGSGKRPGERGEREKPIGSDKV
jgi:hypothetical protein